MALEQKPFSDLITFSRASSGWYYNASGLLAEAVANQPRFDYDPVTKRVRGLLIEEERTNGATDSSNFGIWSIAGPGTGLIISTAAASPGPRGASTMTKIERTDLGIKYLQKSVSGFPSATGSLTVYAKAGALGKFLSMRAQATFPSRADAQFNLETGEAFSSVAGDSTNAIATMDDVGGGVWRCRLTATSGATPWAYVLIAPHIDHKAVDSTPTGLADIYVDAAQVERGAFPTSYIPTGSVPVTRAADSVAMSTLAPWYRGDAGTLIVEAQADWGDTEKWLAALVGSTPLADASFSSLIGVDRIADFVQGGARLSPAFLAVNKGSIVKVGIAADLMGSTLSQNGASIGASDVASPTVDKMLIGASSDSVTRINGHVRAIRYYPRRLSDAELRALTA